MRHITQKRSLRENIFILTLRQLNTITDMKQNFHKLLTLLIMGLVLISCTKKPKENEAWITGQIQGNSFSKLVVEELTPEGIQKIDSTTVINNKFKVTLKLSEPGFYFLRFSSTNFISLVVEPGNVISLEAPADSIGYPTTLNGSTESMLLLDLNHNLDQCYRVTDSLSRIFKSYQGTDAFDSIKAVLDTTYYTMFTQHKTWLTTYIETHPKSLTTIIAFYQNLGRRSFFSANEDYAIMAKIDQNLGAMFPKNQHVVKFHALFLNQKVLSEQKSKADSLLKPGNQMPDLLLPNPEDRQINASQIGAGKRLFVFWNIKSMVDNPDISTLNSLPGGVKVVAISIEEDVALWKTYIKERFPKAAHAIEAHGFEGPIARMFNITEETIPYYVLVDGQNRIIAHHTKLSTVLSNKR